MKFAFLIIFLFSWIFSYSQSNDGKIKIIKDDKISWLIEQHKKINEENNTIPGYRVQIYSDSGSGAKLRTQREQRKFIDKYTEIGSYLVYEEPYFKLRVGNFRTRLDARRLLEEISSEYSYAFIVPDKIEFPGFEEYK